MPQSRAASWATLASHPGPSKPEAGVLKPEKRDRLLSGANNSDGSPSDVEDEWLDRGQPSRSSAAQMPVDENSVWIFINHGTFQAIAASVIFVNTIMIGAELSNPKWKEALRGAENAALAFYVFELVGRLSLLRWQFLLGPFNHVRWNVLDLVVVVCGVVDQWLMPLIAGDSSSSNVISALRSLRLLRLLRVLKLVRLLLEADLQWTEEPLFESFIGMVIVFNAMIMGFETDHSWGGFFYIEQVLLVIYSFELAVRLKKWGWAFFYNDSVGWNLLDLSIVASSVLDSWIMPLLILLNPFNSDSKDGGKAGQLMVLMRMMRLMRILRIVRVVKAVRPLYTLVMGVVAALQGVGWVLLLTLVTLYAAAILSTRLIGHGDILPEGAELDDIAQSAFASVPDSMFMLFRLMNGAQSAQEAEAIDVLMLRVPMIKFWFVFFMITYTWTLLSILTAVVSDNMIAVTTEQAREEHEARVEAERARRVAALRELFVDIDADRSGLLEEKEFRDYMLEGSNTARWEQLSGLSAHEVPTVLNTLSKDGGAIDLDYFIDVLTDTEATSITERTVIKIQMNIDSMAERQKASEQRQEAWQAETTAMIHQMFAGMSRTEAVVQANEGSIEKASSSVAKASEGFQVQAEHTKLLNRILDVLPSDMEARAGAVREWDARFEKIWAQRHEEWERKHDAWQASLLQQITNIRIGDVHPEADARAFPAIACPASSIADRFTSGTDFGELFQHL